jgi:hypothetical protein
MKSDIPFVDHPLLSPSLAARIAKLDQNFDDADRRAFLACLQAIVVAHDQAFAVVAENVNRRTHEMQAKHQERYDQAAAEASALLDKVDADYEQIIAPVAEYLEKMLKEREELKQELAAPWNEAMVQQKKDHDAMLADMQREVDKFKRELFKLGKTAVDELVDEMRTELRDRVLRLN